MLYVDFEIILARSFDYISTDPQFKAKFFIMNFVLQI